MVESRYVLYGLVAGAVSGVVAGVAVFLTMPTVDEVLEYIRSYNMDVARVVEELPRTYLAVVLRLSPLIVFVFSLMLGAVFGAVYEYIDERVPGPPVLSVLLTGLVYAVVLVVPNVVLGAGWRKILVNTVVVLSYAVVLLVLAMVKPPTTQDGERYSGVEG